MFLKSFKEVQTNNLLCRYIRRILVKASVKVKKVLQAPGGMAESSNRWEFIPVGRLRIINFQRKVVANVIGSSSYNHKQCPNENA